MQEIEQKYLIKSASLAQSILEQSQSRVVVKEIKQAYLSIDEEEKSVWRVRISNQKDSAGLNPEHTKCVWTYKKDSEDPQVRTEIEQEIEEHLAQKLYEQSSRKIEKTRKTFLFNGNVFEMDFFKGPHEGLILLEVEKDNREKIIDLPAGLTEADEVTHRPDLRNDALARKTSRSQPNQKQTTKRKPF